MRILCGMCGHMPRLRNKGGKECVTDMSKVLMKGNEAMAEAAMRAGCSCYFGYPITPQTEIAAYFAKHMQKRGGTFIQAESEIAAVNMTLGAASAGARAMTSSSSPGISLKSEGISYLAASDLPCVIVNVERGGPGLGGIQPAQSDYNQAVKAPGHGDLRIPVLAPDSVPETAELTFCAFDLADKYRTPVIILSDGLIGQMMEPVDFSVFGLPEIPEKPWACSGHGFKRKHNIINSLYLKPDMLENSVKDRFKRYKEIEENETKSESRFCNDAEIVITAFGSAARIAGAAVEAAREQGIKAGLFRPVTLYPFPVKELCAAVKNARCILDVEMNMGQMINDVKLYTECRLPVYFYGRTGGNIPSAEEILGEMIKITKNVSTADICGADLTRRI